MKTIFSTGTSSKTSGIALLIFRVGLSALMLTHGIPKMLMLVSGDIQFPSLLGLSSETSLTLAVFAEVFCSIFILLGFGTRLAAVPLIVTMLVAIFLIHGSDPFAKQEPAVYYLLSFLILLIAGSGKYSLDHTIVKRSITPTKEQVIYDPTYNIYS